MKMIQKPICKILSLVALFVVISITAKAQLSSELKLSGAYYSGNVDKSDLRFGAKTAFKDTVYEFSANVNAIYGKNEGVENNKEFSGGLKFDYMPESKLSPFVSTTIYQNTFKGYDLRLSAFGGLKYTFLQTKSGLYSISSAVVYDHERYTEDEETKIKPVDKNLLRLSIRPKFTQKLGPSIELDHTTFLKYTILKDPEGELVLDDNEVEDKNQMNNWNISSETSLNNKLGTKLYLSITYKIEYDGKPPKKGIDNTDTILLVSLKLKI